MDCCVMCGALSNDANFLDEITDQDVLNAADQITVLYERMRDLQREQEPQPKHVQTSGGICPHCGGFTTYTRQNDGRGCMKCEGERKQK